MKALSSGVPNTSNGGGAWYLVVAQGVQVEAVRVGARRVPQESVAVLGGAKRSSHHSPLQLEAIHLQRRGSNRNTGEIMSEKSVFSQLAFFSR